MGRARSYQVIDVTLGQREGILARGRATSLLVRALTGEMGGPGSILPDPVNIYLYKVKRLQHESLRKTNLTAQRVGHSLERLKFNYLPAEGRTEPGSPKTWVSVLSTGLKVTWGLVPSLFGYGESNKWPLKRPSGLGSAGKIGKECQASHKHITQSKTEVPL